LVSLRHVRRQTSQQKPLREAPPTRIVVPVSGDAGDRRLLDVIGKIGARQRVDVTLVFVVEVQQSMPLDAELPNEIERGERALGNAEDLAEQLLGDNRHSPVRTELLQARSAGAAIVDEAIDRNADLILLASTLRRKYGRVTMGETIGYVLKNAPCEVILVRLAQPEWQIDDVEQQ
jgi:nucleotide-binding universal stress UspA family protein